MVWYHDFFALFKYYLLGDTDGDMGGNQHFISILYVHSTVLTIFLNKTE